MKVHKGVEVYLYSFFNLGAAWGWVVNATLRLLYTPGSGPAFIIYEAGCAPEPVWMGAENLAYTGIRPLDRSNRRKSLYRLSYSGSNTYPISCIVLCATKKRALSLTVIREFLF
jgi:hypothetical protein